MRHVLDLARRLAGRSSCTTAYIGRTEPGAQYASLAALPVEQLSELPDPVAEKAISPLIKLLCGRGGDTSAAGSLPLTLTFIPELRLIAVAMWSLSRKRHTAVQAVKQGATEALCGWIALLLASDRFLLSAIDNRQTHNGHAKRPILAPHRVGCAAESNLECIVA